MLELKQYRDPWIAEGVNIVAQGSLLIGSIALRRAGLKDFRLKKEAVTV